MKYYSKLGTSYQEIYETSGKPVERLIRMSSPRPEQVNGVDYISTEDGLWILPKGDPIAERAWRDSELTRADIELNKAQDGDGTGTVKAWREYRKVLRAYPETEGFPDASLRPVAPDTGL